MVEICFLTSKYFPENISVIRLMFMSKKPRKKHSFSSSVEVILVRFTIFSIVRVFLAFIN